MNKGYRIVHQDLVLNRLWVGNTRIKLSYLLKRDHEQKRNVAKPLAVNYLLITASNSPIQINTI